jgi:hypothetical protein
MSYLVVFLLLWLGQDKVSSQKIDTLGLLYENKILNAATVIRSERISLEYKFESNETVMRESFIKIKNAGEGWLNLAFLQGATLKPELLKAISGGIQDLRQALGHAGHLYSFLDPNHEVKPQSSCVYEVPTLSMEALMQGATLISTQFEKINKEWTEEQILADSGKLHALYAFIATFNGQTNAWKNLFSTCLSEYDILRGGTFPSTLLGFVEQADCLKTTDSEIIKVMGCKGGKNNLICEIEFNYPTKVTQFTEMVPINYDGVELDGPESGLIYAKDPQTQSLVLLNCSHNEFNNPETPLCLKVEGHEKCLKGLLLQDLDFAADYCHFRQNVPEIAKRLSDNGILVLHKDAKVTDNGKMVFKSAPMVIYSNHEVTVSLNEDELTFPNQIKFEKPKLVTSNLSKKIIETLKGKAFWDSFWSRFAPEDYLIYVVIGVQFLILFPLSLCGIFCGMKRRPSKARPRKIERECKRRNFSENQKLLATPVTMPMVVRPAPIMRPPRCRSVPM